MKPNQVLNPPTVKGRLAYSVFADALAARINSDDANERLVKYRRIGLMRRHLHFKYFFSLSIKSAPDCGITLSLKEFRLSVSNGSIGVDPAAPQRGRRNKENIVNKFKVHVPIEIRSDKAAHMPQHGNKTLEKHTVTYMTLRLLPLLLIWQAKRKMYRKNMRHTATADLASEAEDVSEEYEALEQEVITTSDPLQKPNPNIDSQNERNSHTNQVAESMALTASTKTPFLETLDDTDLFFLSMSIITKKLPKTEQVQIKLALSNSVLSAELRANNGQSFFYLHRQQVEGRGKITEFITSSDSGSGSRKTDKLSGYPEMEKALFTWSLQERARVSARPLDDSLIELLKEHRGTAEKTKPKCRKKIVLGANMSAVDEPAYTAEVQDVVSTSTAEQGASNASISSKAPKVTRESQRKRQDSSKYTICCTNWKDNRGRANWIQCTKCQECICSPCNKDRKDPYFICERCDDSQDMNPLTTMMPI
ncbi:hypothetical protein QE152_g12537 [Popillia japonica]|uniref:Uncharacterized protein n=1 Tax=Popillia japonica TaxID=7064 RepID=A0AAW1LPL2_POPJA